MQTVKPLVALVWAAFTSTASANVFVTSEFHDYFFLPAPPVNANGLDATFVSNALMYDDPNTFVDAALRIDLTSGDTFEGHGGYTSVDFNTYSNRTDADNRFYSITLTYDTYVGRRFGTASVLGGADDLGGGPLSITPQNISIKWEEGSQILGLFQIGNISLTPDSMGTWSFTASNDLGQRFEKSGDVINGYMLVPEPAGLIALGLGMPVLLRRMQ